MKRILQLTVGLVLGSASISHAFPPPEDVLRPEPDRFPYYYLQPTIELGVSTLMGEAVRPVNASGLGEIANGHRTDGSGLGLGLGLDLGVVLNNSFGAHVGAFLNRDAVANDGDATAECVISDGQVVVGTVNEDVVYDYDVVTSDLGIRLGADYFIGALQFSVGYEASFPFSTEYTESDQIADTGSACFYYSDSVTRVVSGSASESGLFSSVRHGLLLAGAYRIPVGDDMDVVVGLQYRHPFSDLWSERTSAALESEQTDVHEPVLVPLNKGSRIGTLSATVGLRFNHINL